MPVYSMKVVDADLRSGFKLTDINVITGVFTIPPNHNDMTKIIKLKQKYNTPRITRARLRYSVKMNTTVGNPLPLQQLQPPSVRIGVVDCRGEGKEVIRLDGKPVSFIIVASGYKIDEIGEVDITEHFNCVNPPFGLNVVRVVVYPGNFVLGMSGKIEIWVDVEVIGI